MKKISFEVRQASKIVDVEPRILRYWSEIRAITPYQDAVGTPGIRRRYSFENLIEAAILRELRKQGVTIILGAKALEKLREKKFGKNDREQGFCYLQIIGGDKINIVTAEEVNLDQKFLDDFTIILTAAMAILPHSDFLKKSVDLGPAEEFIANFKKLYDQKGPKKILEDLTLRVGVASLGVQLTKDLKESAVIIPVHALWRQVQDKINNFEFM